MRIARSTSPRRRKRLPSANCSSTVCGFSLATWRNDSIALSGCSFSRKLSPRKYDDGIARDSESSDFKSTRAAIHPMPKKIGRARSHQNSNSMDVGRRHGDSRQRRIRRRGHRRHLRRVPAQLADLPALPHHGGNPCEEADHDAGDEDHEQDEDQRRLPRLARKAEEFDFLAVLHGEPTQEANDDEAED